MSESKKELIEEHRRLTRILKDGTLKERLEEYQRQMKELKALLQGEEYKPENLDKTVIPDVDLIKSNYGPKGAGLYDPTVNQKRKAKNVDTIEGIGQNKNVKQYTTAREGTARESAAAQAKKDLAVNKLQPVKTFADMTPEEQEKIKKQYEVKKADDAPPAYEQKVQSFPSANNEILNRLKFLESSGGKNKQHKFVTWGTQAGTQSVSSYGLMPITVREMVAKHKPVKNTHLGKLILSNPAPDAVNSVISRDEKTDAELASHLWNYNSSRLAPFAPDPSHVEAMTVYAHKNGVQGTKNIIKDKGIEAIYNHPYVKAYNQLKGNELKLKKAVEKLQFLQSLLEKVQAEEALTKGKSIQELMVELRTRQPTDAEMNLIINQQCSISNEVQAEAELKAAEERYKQMCEDTE